MNSRQLGSFLALFIGLAPWTASADPRTRLLELPGCDPYVPACSPNTCGQVSAGCPGVTHFCPCPPGMRCVSGKCVDRADFKDDQQSRAEALRFKLLTALNRIGSTPLPKDPAKHCGLRTAVSSKTPTISEWILWNTSLFHPSKMNGVNGICIPLSTSPGARERCDLYFFSDSQGASPWSCGFRFVFDPTRERLDPKTLECVGTC